jgi:predicted nucleotidyltransferase component of viral defense system
MIPELIIQAWRNSHAPWNSLTMAEQDLIISRALVNLYQQAEIKENLVFRGGTALNKIYIQPPARYSEDLDFVQIKSAPIGSIITAIRNALDHWLGEPKRKLTERSAKLIYRYQSIENLPAKLKIEINTTEHYHVLDLVNKNVSVTSDWVTTNTEVKTYQLNELMGTKLRALYQRKKGRDLFDLWYVIENKLVDADIVVDVFNQHCALSQQKVTRAMFEMCFAEKRKDIGFSNDMTYLLHPNIGYDFNQACNLVLDTLVSKLPGDRWKS